MIKLPILYNKVNAFLNAKNLWALSMLHNVIKHASSHTRTGSLLAVTSFLRSISIRIAQMYSTSLAINPYSRYISYFDLTAIKLTLLRASLNSFRASQNSPLVVSSIPFVV